MPPRFNDHRVKKIYLLRNNPIVESKAMVLYLTAIFFETGPMPTPTKSQKPTIVGSGDPDSTQFLHILTQK